MAKRKRKKFTPEEMIMFGKMCGCEECKFCDAWQQEKIVLGMVEMVKNSKRTAEEARKAITEGWLWKSS